jgi:hypothetical protein
MKYVPGLFLILILILTLSLAGCTSPSSTEGNTPLQTPTSGVPDHTVTGTFSVQGTPTPTHIQTSISPSTRTAGETSIPTSVQTSSPAFTQTAGETLVSTSVQTPTPTQAPVTQSNEPAISITELNLQGQYLKITNNGMTSVAMTGYTITNGQGSTLTFIDWPRGDGSTFTFVLNPHSTVTVYYAKEGTVTATELYWPTGGDAWSNPGDTAYLYDPQGRLVSSRTA